jgi:hypothetical protein
MIYSNYNNIITIQYTFFDGFNLEWIKKWWFWLKCYRCGRCSFRLLKLIWFVKHRGVNLGIFRGKIRGGCVVVNPSIWDLAPCRLEHSYTAVVETSVTIYQPIRRNVSGLHSLPERTLWIRICLQLKGMWLFHLDQRTKKLRLNANM